MNAHGSFNSDFVVNQPKKIITIITQEKKLFEECSKNVWQKIIFLFEDCTLLRISLSILVIYSIYILALKFIKTNKINY